MPVSSPVQTLRHPPFLVVRTKSIPCSSRSAHNRQTIFDKSWSSHPVFRQVLESSMLNKSKTIVSGQQKSAFNQFGSAPSGGVSGAFNSSGFGNSTVFGASSFGAGNTSFGANTSNNSISIGTKRNKH